MLGLVEPFVHLEWRRVRELVEPLQRAKETIAELRAQKENLKEQVRVEIERRAKLEEELQECEQTGAENRVLREEVSRLRSSVDDSGRLVKSSRRLQRQQADAMLSLRAENERLLKASEAAGSLAAEVESLRALVCDKDAAVQRQARTMATLKELIQRLRQVHPDVDNCIEEFFHSPTNEEDEDAAEGRAAVRPGGQAAERPRPKTGTVRASGPSSASQMRSASAASTRSPSQPASRASTREAAGAAGASASPNRSPALSKKQLDAIASLYVQLGSRVTVDVQGTTELGAVKYIGLAHSGDPDRVFVGIRLHQAQGNTDGTYKGLRYFTAPPNCGLFIRAHRILGVFNPKKNCHTSMSECIKAYMKLHQ